MPVWGHSDGVWAGYRGGMAVFSFWMMCSIIGLTGLVLVIWLVLLFVHKDKTSPDPLIADENEQHQVGAMR